MLAHTNRVSFAVVLIDVFAEFYCACQQSVVRSDFLVPAQLVVVNQESAEGDLQGPSATLAPRVLVAVALVSVVLHPLLDGACSADTRFLPLGPCNFVGPLCRYMFPESTASPQEVAVSQSLPQLWEGDHEPGDYSSETVRLFSLSTLGHLLWCRMLVLRGFLS